MGKRHFNNCIACMAYAMG